MNDILRPFLRWFVLVFFDDILIYSTSWSDDLRHVRSVLCFLRDRHLFLKRPKCLFGVSSVTYMGHVINREGVAMDQQKVQVVTDWPFPRSVLHGFLGLAGYYHCFTKDFGTLAAPLTKLLKEGFAWTNKAETSFHVLKKALVSSPVLQLPDFSLEFVV